MTADHFELTTRATAIDGLIEINLKQVSDGRGTVRELFRRSAYEAADLPELGPFEQINVTETRRGALRGLHAEDITKIVSVVAGEAFGVYVDLRSASPTFGVVVTVRLTPGVQVLVPRGVGNGFQALVDGTQYAYCFDQEWQPGMTGLACNPLDPQLGIDWPLPVDRSDPAQVSAKDSTAPMFDDVVKWRT